MSADSDPLANVNEDDTSLRDRLLDRCGVPRDCGWTDGMLMDHIDLGLRTNCRTEPTADTPRARFEAQVRDVAWALNCHSLDALVEMPDYVLARYLLHIVTCLGTAQVERDTAARS